MKTLQTLSDLPISMPETTRKALDRALREHPVGTVLVVGDDEQSTQPSNQDVFLTVLEHMAQTTKGQIKADCLNLASRLRGRLG